MLKARNAKHNHINKFCSANQLHQGRIFDNMEFVLQGLWNQLRGCPRRLRLHSNGCHGAINTKIEEIPCTDRLNYLHVYTDVPNSVSISFAMDSKQWVNLLSAQTVLQYLLQWTLNLKPQDLEKGSSLGVCAFKSRVFLKASLTLFPPEP